MFSRYFNFFMFYLEMALSYSWLTILYCRYNNLTQRGFSFILKSNFPLELLEKNLVIWLSTMAVGTSRGLGLRLSYPSIIYLNSEFYNSPFLADLISILLSIFLSSFLSYPDLSLILSRVYCSSLGCCRSWL